GLESAEIAHRGHPALVVAPVTRDAAMRRPRTHVRRCRAVLTARRSRHQGWKTEQIVFHLAPRSQTGGTDSDPGRLIPDRMRSGYDLRHSIRPDPYRLFRTECIVCVVCFVTPPVSCRDVRLREPRAAPVRARPRVPHRSDGETRG